MKPENADTDAPREPDRADEARTDAEPAATREAHETQGSEDDGRAETPTEESPAHPGGADPEADTVIDSTAPGLPAEPPMPAGYAQEPTEEIDTMPDEPLTSNGSRHRVRLRAATPLLLAGLIGGGVAAGITVGVDAADGDGTSTTIIREAAPRATELTALDPQAPGSEVSGMDALSVEEIYELASPAVVQITTSIESDDAGPFEGGSRGGLGSGFVIDKEGHIVTNFHVIDSADSVRVVFSDGDGFPAKVIGSDPSTDIALLRVDIDGRALTPLRLGDSDDVDVGEPAIAIGNPFGLDRTITTGIVSAVQRQIRAPDAFRIEDVIQTDAAINSGNSGGPLLNELGEVIGVNSQIITDGGTGNVGIGFAVPVNTVKDVVTQLIETGEVAHAFLGATVQSLTEELQETVRLPVDEGVLIADVRPDTPAADAGLQGGDRDVIIDGQTFTVGGDIITSVDGEPVSEASEVVTAVSDKKPGDLLELEITRNDATTETVTVELGRRPSPTG